MGSDATYYEKHFVLAVSYYNAFGYYIDLSVVSQQQNAPKSVNKWSHLAELVPLFPCIDGIKTLGAVATALIPGMKNRAKENCYLK